MKVFQAVIAALGILAIVGIFGLAVHTGAPLFGALLFSALVVTIVGFVVGGV